MDNFQVPMPIQLHTSHIAETDRSERPRPANTAGVRATRAVTAYWAAAAAAAATAAAAAAAALTSHIHPRLKYTKHVASATNDMSRRE
jgi:hypothetical protein